MDVTALMAVLLNQLWFLLPLLLLATIAKSPWFKGMIGEWLLNLSIRLFLDRQEYHLHCLASTDNQLMVSVVACSLSAQSTDLHYSL